MSPRFFLASASPRRRELLLQGGYRFEVRSVEIDETPLPGEDAITLALRLARVKAEGAIAALAAQAEPQVVCLGADTVVASPQGELLAKPADDADAARMLRQLAGGTHQVVTGVCVADGSRSEAAAALTYVTLQTLAEAEITAYVASGEPRGKAGAYAIQGRAARFISRIHGDYSNVVGLPLSLVATILAAFEIFPD